MKASRARHVPPADDPQTIWSRCTQLIEKARSTNSSLGACKVVVDGRSADLAVLIGTDGKAVRFWVRSVQSNALLAVGDLHGPLPLSVVPLHSH